MRLAVPGANRDATPVFIDLEAWNTARRAQAAPSSRTAAASSSPAGSRTNSGRAPTARTASATT